MPNILSALVTSLLVNRYVMEHMDTAQKEQMNTTAITGHALLDTQNVQMVYSASQIRAFVIILSTVKMLPMSSAMSNAILG